MTKVNVNGNPKEVLVSFNKIPKYQFEENVGLNGVPVKKANPTGQYIEKKCIVFPTGQMGSGGEYLVEAVIEGENGIYVTPSFEEWESYKKALGNCAKGETPNDQYENISLNASIQVNGGQPIYLQSQNYETIAENYKNAIIQQEQVQTSTNELNRNIGENAVVSEAAISLEEPSLNSSSEAYSSNDIIPSVDSVMGNSQGFDINPDLIPVPDLSLQNNMNTSSDFVQDTSMNTSPFSTYNSNPTSSGVLETQTFSSVETPQMSQNMGAALENNNFGMQMALLTDKYTNDVNALTQQFREQASLLAQQYQNAMGQNQIGSQVASFPNYTEEDYTYTRAA